MITKAPNKGSWAAEAKMRNAARTPEQVEAAKRRAERMEAVENAAVAVIRSQRFGVLAEGQTAVGVVTKTEAGWTTDAAAIVEALNEAVEGLDVTMAAEALKAALYRVRIVPAWKVES